MRYFITFACYGAHLHWEESGSVDRHHNQFGSRSLELDAQRVAAELQRMTEPLYQLDRDSRAVVLDITGGLLAPWLESVGRACAE